MSKPIILNGYDLGAKIDGIELRLSKLEEGSGGWGCLLSFFLFSFFAGTLLSIIFWDLRWINGYTNDKPPWYTHHQYISYEEWKAEDKAINDKHK